MTLRVTLLPASAALKVQNLFLAQSPEKAYQYVWKLKQVHQAAEDTWIEECRKRGMSLKEIHAIVKEYS
jgi:hypothetical protein